MLESVLAELYCVQTKVLLQAIKRNLVRFPADFMFQLTAEEFGALRSQLATSNDQSPGRGGRRYAPRVFAEHGALMAATIHNSPRAVEISIYVVRAFVRLRELATSHGELAKRLDELEQKTEALAMSHDIQRHGCGQPRTSACARLCIGGQAHVGPQQLHRVAGAHPVALDHPIDGPTADAAAGAVPQVLGRRHHQAGRVVLVEWAAAE